MSAPGPHIAIIGAGPSGLLLSRLLSTLSPSLHPTIFELDPGPISRDQGGTLDLSTDDGQLALREAGLFPAFEKLARAEGQARKQVAADGTVLWDDNGKESTKLFEQLFESPEIDRRELRGMLIESVAEGGILWGRKLREVTQDAGDKKYTLHFTEGKSAGGWDLVVGADGAWSHVRPLVTDVRPHYSGITMAELWALDADNKAPWLGTYVGGGSCFTFDEGRAIIAQRAGHGNIRVYTGLRVPETWADESKIDWKDDEAAKAALIEQKYADCGEDLKRMIVECKDGMYMRKLYMLPVGVQWESRPGVTLIGDAAHLMTPFAGVGVNLAMRDALELARAIVREADLGTAVREYEREMFARSKRYAQVTVDGMKGHFSANGNEDRVEKMKQQQGKREKAIASRKMQLK